MSQRTAGVTKETYKLTCAIISHFLVLVVTTLCKLTSQCDVCYLQSHRLSVFDGKAVSDFPLTTQYEVLKTWQCTQMCFQDSKCRSYRYNNLTGVCTTYGAGYSLPEETLIPITAETGSQLHLMCGKTNSFGTKCSSIADCSFSNCVCDNGARECDVGYSYDVPTGNCVEKCYSYGQIFTMYTDHGVAGCNTVWKYTSSPQECMEACRDETSLMCVNAEYEVSSGKCNMCEMAWFDLSPSSRVINDYGWNLYYRHCAY